MCQQHPIVQLLFALWRGNFPRHKMTVSTTTESHRLDNFLHKSNNNIVTFHLDWTRDRRQTTSTSAVAANNLAGAQGSSQGFLRWRQIGVGRFHITTRPGEYAGTPKLPCKCLGVVTVLTCSFLCPGRLGWPGLIQLTKRVIGGPEFSLPGYVYLTWARSVSNRGP